MGQLLQVGDIAVEMNKAHDLFIMLLDYVGENIRSKVAKTIQNCTGVINKVLWKKY